MPIALTRGKQKSKRAGRRNEEEANEYCIHPLGIFMMKGMMGSINHCCVAWIDLQLDEDQKAFHQWVAALSPPAPLPQPQSQSKKPKTVVMKDPLPSLMRIAEVGQYLCMPEYMQI